MVSIVGANRISIQDQLDIIASKIRQRQNDSRVDSEFAAKFNKSKPVVTAMVEAEKVPFSSLGAYIDFAMFDARCGYYTNKVNIGLSHDIDFGTQLHNGLGFVFGVLVQAYNVWLTQVRAGTRAATDTFNIVEPGAGVGIFAMKLLTIIDNLDINSLQGENRANWLAFTSQLRLHLSDRSPLQVANIKKTLAEKSEKLYDKTLLNKVSVECCALSEVKISADFMMIQEVFDVLPIERIKFSNDGIKVAIVIPTVANAVDDVLLREWLAKHSELSPDELKDKYVLSNLCEELDKVTWLQTYVDIDHFPEIKQQVMQFYDYYATLAAQEKDKTINIRRQLTPSLAPLNHLRGAALVFDYGHTCHDAAVVKNHPFYELRLYPQNDTNSDYDNHGFFGFLSTNRITRPNAYLINPGKYDITANVDFSELLHHLSDQHVPVCYGSQSITSTDHFLDVLRSMPQFTTAFIKEEYLPAYEYECRKYEIPHFELESPLVVSLRLFTDYIGAASSFKQLMLANTAFAAKLQGHYEVEFGVKAKVCTPYLCS